MTPEEHKRRRNRFLRSRRVEKSYAGQLLQIAKQIGLLVDGLAPDGKVENLSILELALDNYVKLIEPWSRSVAAKMITQVSQHDEISWRAHGREIGLELTNQLRTTPLRQVMRQLVNIQVELITSLPVQASERVHKLVVESMLAGGVRASEIAKEIQKSGEVAASRARTIARTEVTRTAATLTQARAMAVGSPGYIWRTAGDSDVRLLHKELEGQLVKSDEPPVAGSNGERAHAGCIYNCRCWMEPILPDVIQ
jgi:SPP1 gp7 family putative phage head morphogenesis protein